MIKYVFDMQCSITLDEEDLTYAEHAGMTGTDYALEKLIEQYSPEPEDFILHHREGVRDD